MKRNTFLFSTLFLFFIGLTPVKAQTYLTNPFAGTYFQPHFGLNTGMLFNHQDFLLDFGVGLEELGYDFSATIQGSFRPFYSKVLSPESDKYFYQIEEKVIQFSLDLEKRFYFLSIKDEYKMGLYAKVKGGYFWGKYKGLSKNRNQQFVLNPGGGFAFHLSPIIQFSVGYLWMQQNPYVNPHTINLRLNFYLSNIGKDSKN